MSDLNVKFVAADGSSEKEKTLRLRGDGPITYDRLLDALTAADLDTFAGRLERNEFKVDGRDPRELQYQGRVVFKSTLEAGIGNGAGVSVSAQAQGQGSGVCTIPAGSTIAAAFKRAGVTVPANATIVMDGQPASLTTLIPARNAVQIAAMGAVKGG